MRWIDDAVVVVDDGRFVEVGPYDGRPVHQDLRPGVLLPGFVDSHVHFPQTRIIGSASGPLLPWLERSTFPEESRFADGAHASAVAAEFAERMTAAGTTLSMVYSSVHPDACHALFEVFAARGLRTIAGPVLMDAHSPEQLLLPPEAALPALEQLVRDWHGHDDRLAVAVVPRFALSCTEAMMRGAAELANEHGLWVTTHLSENLDEVRIATERFGADDYLEVYERFGLVHARSVYAHCIHLSDDEWDRFAEAGAVVAHCPDSNDFLGSGGMPVGAVLDRGIPLSLGTDVAAGRTFQVPRIASSAYDNGLRVGRPLSLARLLYTATRGGALALDHAHVGAIEEGLEADMVLVEVPWWTADAEQALSSVFFDHDRPLPKAVWVRGQLVAGAVD
jgi:guanine deaminase